MPQLWVLWAVEVDPHGTAGVHEPTVVVDPLVSYDVRLEACCKNFVLEGEVVNPHYAPFEGAYPQLPLLLTLTQLSKVGGEGVWNWGASSQECNLHFPTEIPWGNFLGWVNGLNVDLLGWLTDVVNGRVGANVSWLPPPLGGLALGDLVRMVDPLQMVVEVEEHAFDFLERSSLLRTRSNLKVPREVKFDSHPDLPLWVTQ